MLKIYYKLIPLIGLLQYFAPVYSNALLASSELSLSLHNCNKDKLLQFPDPSSVTELHLQHCNISTLENLFCVRFTSLTHLEITDSQLNFLEDYALNGLKHLRSLSLAHNNLTQVKSWSNEPMPSLASLDLQRNAISKLSLKSFFRYPNLQHLNLMGNVVENIDDGVFHWMPQLRYLNLGRNRLIAVENRNFHAMHRLSYLALHFNAIEKVENESFATNNYLRTLRLEANKLRNLDFLKVKSLTRLQHLNLSFNELETLDGTTFSNDYEIVDLDLSHNFIKEIKADSFLGLEELVSLNVSHNQLHLLAANSFNALYNLEFLELNHNEIKDLHTSILNITSQLQHINLAHNQLVSMNATLFSTLSCLKTLDLSQNQLSNDEFIENLASELQCHRLRLNLTDNHYCSVNISSLLSFEQVELAGNWWSCKWLIKQMLKIPKSINFGHTYAVNTEWSLSMLDAKGISCYDEDTRRNLIILDTSKIWEQKLKNVICGGPTLEVQPSLPPLNWPRIKLDRFDSRSVVLWMLIAIALAFSALRIGRKLVDQNERKKRLLILKDKQKHKLEKQALKESFQLAGTDIQKNLMIKLALHCLKNEEGIQNKKVYLNI